MAHRHGAQFVMDWRPHVRPLDRNERAKIYFLALALERKTKPPGRRNGVLGYVGLAVLHALMFQFLNRATGLCCPSYYALQDVTGLCRQSIACGLARLERTGIVRIVRRLCRQHVNRDGWSFVNTTQATSLYAMHRPPAWAEHLPRQTSKHAPFPDRRQLGFLLETVARWKVQPSLASRKEPNRIAKSIAFHTRNGALE